MKILIVKLSAIGDVIHTLPALNALRRRYPDARIDWVVEEAAFPIIDKHRALDRVILSRRKRWINELKGPGRMPALREIRRFFRDLRKVRYDIVVDFQGLMKSGMLVGLARGKRKVGFGKGMEHQEHSYLFLNERIPAVKMDRHALLRYLTLLEGIGIHGRRIEYNIPIGPENRRAAGKLLARFGTGSRGPLVAINPVAQWETKLWYNDRFAELADRLADEFGARVFFTGGPEDRETTDDIMRQMKHGALNLAGKTDLKTLAAIYGKADLLVTTDTGPMHLGAAMNLPTVALFGPTAPWRTGPFGPDHRVIRKGLPCSPCFKRDCPTRRVCMAEIGVEDVMDRISKNFEFARASKRKEKPK